MIDERLRELQDRQDDDVDPKIPIQPGGIPFIPEPKDQHQDDKGKGKHVYRLVEKRVSRVADQEEHGDPIDPRYIFKVERWLRLGDGMIG